MLSKLKYLIPLILTSLSLVHALTPNERAIEQVDKFQSNPYQWIDERGLGKPVMTEKEIAFGNYLHQVNRATLIGWFSGALFGVAMEFKLAKDVKDFMVNYVYMFARSEGWITNAAPSNLSMYARRVWDFLWSKFMKSDEYQMLNVAWKANSVRQQMQHYQVYRQMTFERMNKVRDIAIQTGPQASRAKKLWETMRQALDNAKLRASQSIYDVAIYILASANKQVEMTLGYIPVSVGKNDDLKDWGDLEGLKGCWFNCKVPL